MVDEVLEQGFHQIAAATDFSLGVVAGVVADGNARRGDFLFAQLCSSLINQYSSTDIICNHRSEFFSQ